MKKIGFIGLGNVGTPAAINLLKAGFEVHGYDLRRCEPFISAGGRMAASLGGVATCDIIVQSLPTAPAARTLALDPRGPRIFLPVADLGPLLPKTGDTPARPAIIPSTFRILTVGR